MARVIPKTGYGGIYGGEAAGKPEDPSKKRAEKAANDFAGAEKSASSGAPEVKDKTTSGSTDIAENGAAGQHTPRYNSGAKGAGDKAGGGVAAAAAKATPAGRFLSRLRNGTGGERNNKPLFAIGGITGIVAVMFMGVSSLLPIHLIENAIDIKNSFNTTSELRGARLIRRAIGKDNAAAMTTFSRRNTLSANKVAQMNRGLEPEGLRLVRGADGNIELRSAMDLDTGRINTNTDGTIRWDNTVAVNEVEFGRVIRENPGVRNGFNKGARTMKGKTAGWFNRALAFFLKSNALTRNLFRDFIGRTEGNANFREAAARIEVAEARVRKNNVELATQDRVPNDSNNPPADLNDPTATRPVVDGGTPNRAADFNSAKISIDADLKARAMSIAGKASSIASALVAPCSVMLGISAASAMFAAIEAAKGLQVVAAWFEAGQKAKAGAGDDSYYAFGTALTEATVTTVADEDGNDVELHGGAKFTATESAGLTSILVGGAFSAESDQSALKYHAEKAIGFVRFSGETASACLTAMAAAGVISAVAEIASVVLSFIPVAGQVFAIGKAIARVTVNSIIQVAVSGLISTAAARLVPMIAKNFVTSFATEVGGEDFGNLIGSMAGRYMAGGHQANGGVVATKERAWAYHQETQTVLAEQAELERLERSPFDLTSRHTFLGSIAYNMSSFAAKNGSLFGKMSSVMGMAQISKMPWQFSASAASRLSFEESLGNCPQLSSIYQDGIGTTESADGKVNSVACDPFGNPRRYNDLRIVGQDPEYIWLKTAYSCDSYDASSAACSFGTGYRSVTPTEYNAELARGGVHLDGSTSWSLADANTSIYCERRAAGSGPCDTWYIPNVDLDSATNLEKINADSDLGKMINYGVNRATDPGVLDVNIMMAEDKSGPSWLGWVPIVGDIQQVISAANQSRALEEGWVDGRNYCDGCTPQWEPKYRHLNQYIVDNNIYEGFGAMERSPVVAFLEDEIWPTMDMSFEGMLARNMGMPKSFVVDTLAWVYDLLETPQDAESLIAAAPNIYAVHYGGPRPNQLTVPEEENPFSIIATMQESTQTAGVELRRRFNSEATA